MHPFLLLQAHKVLWKDKEQLGVDVWYVVALLQWVLLCCTEGELCRPACENGGRCVANEKGDWRCYCWPDFSGDRCEVNHCTDYCLNGGTCTGSPLGKQNPRLFVKILRFHFGFTSVRVPLSHIKTAKETLKGALKQTACLIVFLTRFPSLLEHEWAKSR